jgi:tetratricopeptide (TPR) repeat protein
MLIIGGAAEWAVGSIRLRHRDERRLILLAQALLAVALVTGATRSALRSRIWRSNDVLFHQAVIDSPRAYRAHFMLGAWDFEHERKREGEAEYHRALSLFPYDAGLAYNMAEAYRAEKMCAPAIPLYRWAHELNGNFTMGHSALAWCLLVEGDYVGARDVAFQAIRAGADVTRMRQLVFLADSARKADALKAKSAPGLAAGSGAKAPDVLQKADKKTPQRTTG